VVAEANWQSLQQSSLESSHTALFLNLHVDASQHALFPHWELPPQSQSSPASTMPLPHTGSPMVVMPRLLVRQLDSTELRRRALQMLPMEQGENLVMPCAVEGFMMNCSPASHWPLLSGQHCCELTVLASPQEREVQSCTAP
jgi:hypothetical protein